MSAGLSADAGGPLKPLPPWLVRLFVAVYVGLIAWGVFDRAIDDADLWRYEIPAAVERERLIGERPEWW